MKYNETDNLVGLGDILVEQLFFKTGADANFKSELNKTFQMRSRILKISECNLLHALFFLNDTRHDNVSHLLRLLIQEGVSINAMATCEVRQFSTVLWVWEANPLHLLCESYKHDNLIDLIKLFIQNGIDVNAKYIYGKNVLHLLCEKYEHENLFDLVVLLNKNNIDLKAKTNKGFTASYLLQTNNPSKDKMKRVIDFLPKDDPTTKCSLM